MPVRRTPAAAFVMAEEEAIEAAAEARVRAAAPAP
jgi:hypothetical protein